LFQGDNGKRQKLPFIDRFSSFPNYVAFFFQLSSTILRNFLAAGGLAAASGPRGSSQAAVETIATPDYIAVQADRMT
jgi:hypothetical protein